MKCKIEENRGRAGGRCDSQRVGGAAEGSEQERETCQKRSEKLVMNVAVREAACEKERERQRFHLP